MGIWISLISLTLPATIREVDNPLLVSLGRGKHSSKDPLPGPTSMIVERDLTPQLLLPISSRGGFGGAPMAWFLKQSCISPARMAEDIHVGLQRLTFDATCSGDQL